MSGCEPWKFLGYLEWQGKAGVRWKWKSHQQVNKSFHLSSWFILYKWFRDLYVYSKWFVNSATPMIVSSSTLRIMELPAWSPSLLELWVPELVWFWCPWMEYRAFKHNAVLYFSAPCQTAPADYHEYAREPTVQGGKENKTMHQLNSVLVHLPALMA